MSTTLKPGDICPAPLRRGLKSLEEGNMPLEDGELLVFLPGARSKRNWGIFKVRDSYRRHGEWYVHLYECKGLITPPCGYYIWRFARLRDSRMEWMQVLLDNIGEK